MKKQEKIKHGGGFTYTFGGAQAAVNLTGILQKPEYQGVKRKVLRLLTKQICGMKSIMDIRNEVVRGATLKMWHDKFAATVDGLPEIVRTHTRCVETGIYRQLLKDSKDK